MSNRMTPMGLGGGALRTMRENQRQNALIHFQHDFGFNAAQHLFGQFGQYDKKELLDGILKQRAEMTVAGTLFDAEDKLVGKIDLARLGIKPEDIAKVNEFRAAEQVKGPQSDRRSLLDIVRSEPKSKYEGIR